ncbi:MAG: FecR domain-containing protein [Ignavibacteriaceae bacterium]|nr:FecR domain-containing protein [Ignavibacteriaceae bacterium]
MKLMPQIIDSQFLIKIIKSEANQEEKQLFENWLNESDENKEEFGTLVLLWKKVADSKLPPIPDQDIQWAKLQNQLAKLNSVEPEEAKYPPLKVVVPETELISKKKIGEKKDYGWILKVAAVFVILFSIPLLIYINKNSKSAHRVKQIISSQTESLYSLVAGKGERKTILLSDGSLVYLNVDSKLIYPARFTDSSRVVELIGEAYFSISHDASKPFKVICSNTITVVKGTEFNIKNRNDLVRILLTKGIVETFEKDSNKGITLKKGEMVTFDEKIGFSKPAKANIKHFLAWRKGKFSFSHTPLEDVMEEISRFYNVQVVFRNPAERSKNITGVFDTDSLEHIFSIISLTLDVKIDLNGSKVIVQ